MGQKVNPHGLRVGIIKDWDSRWFVKDSEFGTTLVSDYKLRKYLKKTLFDAGIPKIEIERDSQKAKIIIHCAKPGMVIGQGGSTIETLKKNVAKMVGKPVSISVIEVRSPDLNAQLVAENIGAQLERRISFRRAMKQAIAHTMKLGAKGIKISVSGLLGGADIARTEHYHEGTIPLQTIRADIDYGYHAALTKMGLIGIKVWIYRGEVLTAVKRTEKPEASSNRARDNSNQGRFGRQQQRNDRPGRPQGDRPYQPRGDRPPRNDRPQGGQGGRGGFGRNQQEQPHQGNFGNRKPLNQRTDYRQKQNAPDASKEVPQTQGEGGNNDVNA